MRKIKLIGAAIDACASTRGSKDTPDILNQSFLNQSDLLQINEIFRYIDSEPDLKKLETYFTILANNIKLSLSYDDFPIVIGGDHSCSIGSWSGAADFFSNISEDIGLIWIDAYMNAHTPETTPSGNIHGMPVATLLGYGYNELKTILNTNPKIKPENIILIGIRSYEMNELNLLQKLGVKVYYSHDVISFGFDAVFKKAWSILSTNVNKIGMSINLGGFDPEFTPGVGIPEANGINFNDFIYELKSLNSEKLIALEIVEGNNHLDPSGKTMQCIVDIINIIKDK